MYATDQIALQNALNLAKKTFPALKAVSSWKIVIWARLANGREERVAPETWSAVTSGVKHFTVEVLEDKVKKEEEEITVKIEKEEEEEVKMPFYPVQQPGSSAVSPANNQSTVSGTRDSAQEIWVHIHSQAGGKAIISKLRPSDSVYKLKTKIQDVMELPAGRQTLLHDGERLQDSATLASQSITSGTTLYLFREQTGGKPVIYLYPPMSINAKVRLSLIPGWKFSAVYPQPTEGSFKEGKSTQDVEWDVAVNPSGMIRSQGDSTEVAYLYWEAKYVRRYTLYLLLLNDL
ncbi:hypothetical protein FRC00_008412 [Tulasnella sp. 408]|nr:hypothetical protein FRC00_008412 [Tulasnella sp. 408]